jgi:uncharacterized protein YjiS (DUF1127 family)
MWPPRPYVPSVQRGRRAAIGARPDRATTIESIMTPRQSQEQIGLFAIPTAPRAAEVDALRAQAAASRDAAIGGLVRRFFTGLGQVLAAVGTALVSYPERRAAYDHLRTLTDRELADIGLTRGDIGRVFDPEFRMPVRAANTNAVTARPRAA